MEDARTIPQRSHSTRGFIVSDEPETLTQASASHVESGATLRRQEFLASVVEQLRTELPEELAGFQVKAMSQLVKIYYGNERVHYEVWISANRELTEVGLHFEDGPVSTAAYLAYFDRYIVELKHELGASIELERWTTSWGHLFEIVPLGKLTDFQTTRVANRLAHLIAVLQPLVDAAAVPPERSSSPQEHRGPWRHFRRR
jgi:hypothetical protein